MTGRFAPARSWIGKNPLAPVIVLIAFLVRMSSSGWIDGLGNFVGNDGPIYFTAGQAIVFGELPYRDFVLVHPPGITLLLAPFSLVANFTSDQITYEIVRVVFMVWGALNTFLIYLVASKIGRVAAVIAGLTYCVLPGLVWVERAPYLEAPMLTAILVTLLMIGRGSYGRLPLILSGVLFGLAIGTKLWAVFPMLVLAVAILVYATWRKAVIFAASASLAFAVIVLPFFVLAPASFYDMVLGGQAAREVTVARGITRLEFVLPINGRPDPMIPFSVMLLIFAVVAAVSLLVWLRLPHARVWVALLAVQLAVVMVVPTFFNAYRAYPAIGLALVFAGFGQLCWNWLRNPVRSTQRLRYAVSVPLGLVFALVWVLVLMDRVWHEGRSFPAQTLAASINNERCVTAEEPELIIAADALTSNLAADCPLMVDLGGTAFFTTAAEHAEITVNYLDSGYYVIAGPPPNMKKLAPVVADREVVRTVPNQFTVYGPPSP